MAAYAFYYHNEPNFLQTNLTLRLAVVPVFVDSELGILEALSPNTDLALGLSGGGFADSFSEIREGDYITAESFTRSIPPSSNTSVYHLFNPGDRAPLYGVFRGAMHGALLTSATKIPRRTSKCPNDEASILWRTGLRLGGSRTLSQARGWRASFPCGMRDNTRFNHELLWFHTAHQQVQASTISSAMRPAAHTIEHEPDSNSK